MINSQLLGISNHEIVGTYVVFVESTLLSLSFRSSGVRNLPTSCSYSKGFRFRISLSEKYDPSSTIFFKASNLLFLVSTCYKCVILALLLKTGNFPFTCGLMLCTAKYKSLNNRNQDQPHYSHNIQNPIKIKTIDRHH